jgi:hypothetical protein
LTNKVNVNFKNCDNVSITFDLENGTGNPFVVKGDCEMCFSAQNGQTYYFDENIQNYKMTFEAYPYALDIGVGTPVFRNYYNQVAKCINLGSQFIDGISLSYAGTPVNVMNIAKHGYFEASKLGLDITGKTGQFIKYNYLTGNIEFSTERTADTLGYVTNFGQVYLDIK